MSPTTRSAPGRPRGCERFLVLVALTIGLAGCTVGRHSGTARHGDTPGSRSYGALPDGDAGPTDAAAPGGSAQADDDAGPTDAAAPGDTTHAQAMYDMALIYVGNGCSQSTCKARRWREDDFLPFLVQVHKDMSPVNHEQMFNTFLFLAIRSGLNSRHVFVSTAMQDNLPSTQKDWTWFLNRLFTDAPYQVDALQNATESLGFTTRVMVMIPYPDPTQQHFGDGWDFRQFDNRLSAVKWYIDSFVEMWSKHTHANLILSGFYWMEEHIGPPVPEDERLLPKVADYIHSLKVNGARLAFTWIPAQGPKLLETWTRETVSKWRTYGFDYAFLQPNYYESRYDRTLGDLKDAMQFSLKNGLGTEIECDEHILTDEVYRQRLLDYFSAAEETGISKDEFIAYYQGVYTIDTLAKNGDPLYGRLMQFISHRRTSTALVGP